MDVDQRHVPTENTRVPLFTPSALAEAGMEPAETEAENDGELRAWLNVLTDAVEVLLRQAERQLDREAQAAFAAGEASTVLLRQIERDQAGKLRDDLRSLRSGSGRRGRTSVGRF
jgi:phytoene/squalene synthetase